MTLNTLVVLAVTAFGGVGLGAAFTPFRDKIARQTYCVVRKYNRPEVYELLFESRSPNASRRFMKANQDGTLEMVLRSDMDEFNATALRKSAWWVDFHAMMDAVIEKQRHDYPLMALEPEDVPGDPLEPRMARLETQQTEVLQLLRGLTGEIPVVKWQDPEPRTLQSQREAARTLGVYLPGEPLPEMRNGDSITVAATSVIDYGDEPSVMPSMAPTGWIDMAAIQQEADEQAARDRRQAHLMDRVVAATDPKPTNPRGVTKPGNTRTVVIPLGAPKLPKPDDGPVGGGQ
jgi:hypothetical protein